MRKTTSTTPFGDLIRKRGISLTALAEQTGIARSNVSAHVNGRKPSLKSLEAYADALGVSVAYLLKKVA